MSKERLPSRVSAGQIKKLITQHEACKTGRRLPKRCLRPDASIDDNDLATAMKPSHSSIQTNMQIPPALDNASLLQNGGEAFTHNEMYRSSTERRFRLEESGRGIGRLLFLCSLADLVRQALYPSCTGLVWQISLGEDREIAHFLINKFPEVHFLIYTSGCLQLGTLHVIFQYVSLSSNQHWHFS